MDKMTYKPVSHDHEEFLRESKNDEVIRNEYEALAPAYALIREQLIARQHSGLTQESIAQKIGTYKERGIPVGVRWKTYTIHNYPKEICGGCWLRA